MRFPYHKLPIQEPCNHHFPTQTQETCVDTRAILLLASLLQADIADALLAAEPFLRPCDQIALNTALQAKCAVRQMTESARIRCAIANANARHRRDEFAILDALSDCRALQMNGLGRRLKHTVSACKRAQQVHRDPSSLLFEMMGKQNPLLNLLKGSDPGTLLQMFTKT